MQRWSAVAALPIASLLASCNEFGLDPIDDDQLTERVVVVDEFVQKALPSVDLLFVVDDTASMEQEQNNLADHFASLAAPLEDAEVLWQVGVVSTDVSGTDAGWLRGTPYVISASMSDAIDLVADALQVGTEGSPPESGLAAAVLALDLAGDGGPNAGFRRPGAALHLVFVSDADDQSDDVLGSDAVGAFLDAIASDAGPVTAHALVGDVPDGCSTGKSSARPGYRYVEVAEALDGVVESICSTSFEGLLAAIGDAGVGYPVRFELRELPVAGTVTVDVDGARITSGWTLETDPPAVVFDAPPAPSAVVRVSYVVELL